MSKFKVGDRVRLTGPRWSEVYPDAPEIITIELIDPDGLIIGSDGVRDIGECGELYSFKGYACELVDDELADAVNPSHYSFGNVQVIDITRHMDFLTGNAVKYLTRAGRKGDRLEDLKKAARYVQWAIEDAEK